MRVPRVLCGSVILAIGLSFGWREDSLFRLRVPLGLDEYVPVPEDNLLTAEKVELGRQLFLDTRLSRDSTIACASCHKRELAFTDGHKVAIGIRGSKGIRSVPSLVNRAYGKSFFWDGRVTSLEEQALEPIQNPKEMGLTLPELERRLRSDQEYEEAFQKVFESSPSAQNIARAIASFARTLLSGNSPFDRFVNGDRNALSESAQRGLQIFRGNGNCIACHSGPLFSDESFHNTGVSWGKQPKDFGRYEVTKKEDDHGKFKTPSLRNVALTAPYMHDGSMATLAEVIEFYNRGGNLNPYLDSEIKPLHLSVSERVHLFDFLQSLTSPECVPASAK